MKFKNHFLHYMHIWHRLEPLGVSWCQVTGFLQVKLFNSVKGLINQSFTSDIAKTDHETFQNEKFS